MAEMVSSAVVQETVSQIVSCFVQKNQEEESNVNRNLERLEMAHIRLEAALETSHKWQVTDASLLRWRRKLKRAAQECEGMLHKCKQSILEDKQIHEEVRNSSLPNRIVHATKSFIFSVFNCDNNELSRSVVQRFEWYADSASEFLRFVELGGTPCRNMPFDPLVKNLLAGKGLNHRIVWGTEYPSFQILLLPYNNAEHGKEASLIFIQKDGTPDGNICYSIIVQLSESTDIVGIAIKCLQLFAPHFNCTIENIRKELYQLPTQDFSWLPSICLYKKEQQGTLHSLGSVWFRPNPLCCKHGHHDFQHISNIGIAGLSDVPLEEVIEVNLQFQVSLSLYEKQKTSLTEDVISLKDSPYQNMSNCITSSLSVRNGANIHS